MTCPCKECEERTETCHAECEKYLAFLAECEQRRKERDKKRKCQGLLRTAQSQNRTNLQALRNA